MASIRAPSPKLVFASCSPTSGRCRRRLRAGTRCAASASTRVASLASRFPTPRRIKRAAASGEGLAPSPQHPGQEAGRHASILGGVLPHQRQRLARVRWGHCSRSSSWRSRRRPDGMQDSRAGRSLLAQRKQDWPERQGFQERLAQPDWAGSQPLGSARSVKASSRARGPCMPRRGTRAAQRASAPLLRAQATSSRCSTQYYDAASGA